MQLTLEFFGPLQDRMGTSQMTVSVPAPPGRIDALIALVTAKDDRAAALLDPHIRIAVNDQLVDRSEPLALEDNARIAFLAPFSGG